MAFVARSKCAHVGMKITCPICCIGEIPVGSMMCPDCWSKRAYIHRSIGEISDAFEVTYEVKDTIHGGYCSDADDYEETITHEVRRLPILRDLFDAKDLDSMNSDELLHKYNTIIHVLYTPADKGCGSGFCRGGTEWTIVKISVAL